LATNWIVGFKGRKITPVYSRGIVATQSDPSNATFIDAETTSTSADSLFLQQLQNRAGVKAFGIVKSRRMYNDDENDDVPCPSQVASRSKSTTPTQTIPGTAARSTSRRRTATRTASRKAITTTTKTPTPVFRNRTGTSQGIDHSDANVLSLSVAILPLLFLHALYI
jgi:hypothetical protein